MSGRDIEKNKHKKRYGLYTRLHAHATGRLSGDQFCVYVANRLVIPSIRPEQLQLFHSGKLTLDKLTKQYIHERFEYQFCVVDSSREAFDLENACRSGVIFSTTPLLNPSQDIKGKD
jgi:hypothetical protein